MGVVVSSIYSQLETTSLLYFTQYLFKISNNIKNYIKNFRLSNNINHFKLDN
ncbi:agip162 [Agrotis ipsilon multiple nucleopolyhedrovirus]|uniref:Uncharacterized protein n=1 Tax=Agrotis ipsilon multiple nucleopolyhedrovirus TaxID=208013 RepID=B6D676_9ABAC|nr:agip162 [Agrotis ipsilon multiple nucleopolyhedrovirus]ACI28863.1 unknown [Agrotis ipsilon multiple nucleopolyhedrovirus]